MPAAPGGASAPSGGAVRPDEALRQEEQEEANPPEGAAHAAWPLPVHEEKRNHDEREEKGREEPDREERIGIEEPESLPAENPVSPLANVSQPVRADWVAVAPAADPESWRPPEPAPAGLGVQEQEPGNLAWERVQEPFLTSVTSPEQSVPTQTDLLTAFVPFDPKLLEQTFQECARHLDALAFPLSCFSALSPERLSGLLTLAATALACEVLRRETQERPAGIPAGGLSVDGPRGG